MTGWRARLLDAFVALTLLAGYVAWLLATTRDLGYARDEGFYFQAARSYQAWFELLLQNPGEAVQRRNVDRFWAANSEHPALMKSLFALSHHLLHQKWRVFSEAGTAFRFPGMVMGGLALALTYLWGARVVGRGGALVGALLLGAIPRWFYHSHLDCFDVPVATMWLLTSYLYARSLEPGRGALGWALATGLAYGLFLNTKHNAWIFPFAVVGHAVASRVTRPAGEQGREVRSRPTALFAMALLGPAVLFATWPWLWNEPTRKLAAWANFHLRHDYYNMEFLGQTYWKPPMPRLYAWVMTAATVPTVTLALAGAGVVLAARHALALQRERIARFLPRLAAGLSGVETSFARYSTELLWLLSILASYAPWWSTSTPIFGGTKHWITAYPFFCLLAARGFSWLWERARSLAAGRRWAEVAAAPALGGAVLAGPLWMTQDAHPWALTQYVPLFGGAPGAATLGLNRGFWGYQTGWLAPHLNRLAPPGAIVYVHDTALPSWEQLRADGRVRSDLRGVLSLASSDVALYHHEQHMARVEHQVWVVYGTRTPAVIGAYHGVPVTWFYLRPRATAP